jgi:hypothetical protein
VRAVGLTLIGSALNAFCRFVIIFLIVILLIILPDIPKARLAFQASTDPVETSAQAALAPHPTKEQEGSSDTTLMVMCHANLFTLCRKYL